MSGAVFSKKIIVIEKIIFHVYSQHILSIAYKETDEWYIELQRAVTSGITNGNE